MTFRSVDRLLRVSVHAYSELSLDRLLEGFTPAHQWLVSQNVEETWQRNVVPVHILNNFVQFCGQVSAYLIFLVLLKMLRVVHLVFVEKTVIVFCLNEASLGNIGIRGFLLYESLAFKPQAHGFENFVFLGHVEVLVPKKQFEVIFRQVPNLRFMQQESEVLADVAE